MPVHSCQNKFDASPNKEEKVIHIEVDYREDPSGIPAILKLQKNVEISLTTLKFGDYSMNEQLIIERKSAEDFVQSLVSNRLFAQCANLVKSGFPSFLLLEGNPYKTRHPINRMAIKGALLSVIASWHIPVIYSADKEDTVAQLLIIGRQMLPESSLVKLSGYKPKRLKNHRLKFLQGLPNVGPTLAHRLFEHFGSIEAVVKADTKQLRQVEGIGTKGAARIREFLSPGTK